MDSVNPDPAHIPDDDLQLQGYQDDLDTNGSLTDPITHELTDDPTEELGIDPKEFKKELDLYAFENSHDENDGEDDRREDIESLDMDEDANADS